MDPSLPAPPLPNRERLWGLLCEAAEIEHNLMCCYLYAAFSLKQDESEGLTAEELAAVRGWRREMLDVAIEEMGHLAIVSNLLVALGAPAHFSRQNFPIPPGYHPANMVVRLAPFCLQTLEHFIFLERPEDAQIDDGAGFQPARSYSRVMVQDRLTPVARDYDTVGQLYAAIVSDLRLLADHLGETGLFIGEDRFQIAGALVGMPDVTLVKCLKTAETAIDSIVRQGEGAKEPHPRSHFERFRAIKDEFLALKARRPDFEPGRPAADNPVMRRPPSPEDKVWVSAEPAAAVLDLGNTLYNHSLRCLGLAYSGVPTAAQKSLVDAAIDLMRVLTLVADTLTTLPANVDNPGVNAGLSFATLRSLAALPVQDCAASALRERLAEIAAFAAALGERAPELATLGQSVSKAVLKIAAQLQPNLVGAAQDHPMTSPADPTPPPGAPPQPVRLDDQTEVIPGVSIDLHFKAQRCIHARHCVLGLPAVFKANVEGPWIDPDATTTEALITVAHMCPSGAIGYARKDGGPEESTPPVNLIQLRENGPLGVRADIVLDGHAIGLRATLCRCGASKNKPFCDGSHHEIAFQATGEPATRPSEPLAARGGPLRIDPATDGPLVVSGNLEICAGTGRTVDRVTSARLCRCGASENKPFCDGSHRRVGFRSE